LPGLDARMLARERLFPGDWFGRYSYDFAFIVPAIARLTLTRGNAEIMHRDGRRQTIPVHWNVIGGAVRSRRPTFVCRCGRRAFRLYLVGSFVCRVCSRGVYACQACYSAHRPALQSIRLRRFMGAWAGKTGLPPRPMCMPWVTYTRLIERLRKLDAQLPKRWKSRTFSDRMLLPTVQYSTQSERRL
jgi:hypothetical protein